MLDFSGRAVGLEVLVGRGVGRFVGFGDAVGTVRGVGAGAGVGVASSVGDGDADGDGDGDASSAAIDGPVDVAAWLDGRVTDGAGVGCASVAGVTASGASGTPFNPNSAPAASTNANTSSRAPGRTDRGGNGDLIGIESEADCRNRLTDRIGQGR